MKFTLSFDKTRTYFVIFVKCWIKGFLIIWLVLKMYYFEFYPVKVLDKKKHSLFYENDRL